MSKMGQTASLATVVGLALAASLLAAPATAQAFEPGLRWAVGAKGGMNLSLLSEPAEDVIDIPVPGFVGTSGGGGFAAEMLFGDFVGLEVDVIYAKTYGKGSIEIGTVDIDQEIESTELQIPVLLKGQIPFGVVKPFLSVGLTFVNQSDAKHTIDEEKLLNPPSTEPASGDLAKSYSMLTLGLGAAVDLPFVRIPFEVRGMYQSLDNDPKKRADFTMDGTRLAVYPTWEGQIWLLIGVQYSDGMLF